MAGRSVASNEQSAVVAYTWQDVSPVPGGNYVDGCLDRAGLIAIACRGGTLLSRAVFVSTDRMKTWIDRTPTPNRSWTGVYANGSWLAALESGGALYVSSNNGASWTQINAALGATGGVACYISSDGQTVVYLGAAYVYITVNGGTNWNSAVFSVGSLNEGKLAVLEGESKIAVTDSYGEIRYGIIYDFTPAFVSMFGPSSNYCRRTHYRNGRGVLALGNQYGNETQYIYAWNLVSGSNIAGSVAANTSYEDADISDDGQIIFAVTKVGSTATRDSIIKSVDGGATFVEISGVSAQYYNFVSCSANGLMCLAGRNGNLYALTV